MSDNSAVSFLYAKEILSKGQQCLSKAYAYIKSQCMDGEGKLSSELLDNYQYSAYELAYCSAEFSAASFLIDYAEKLHKQKSGGQDIIYEQRIAMMFCAEVVQNARSKLSLRLLDYGISAALYEQTLNHPELNLFCQEQLQTCHYVALGEQLIQQEGYIADPQLGEDINIMREAFQKFSTDVVMPLAEHIHREDLLVPNEILQPLVDMGCFGLSIPEQYGGLQADGEEDTMGMIVVTEELSRGSLAAAGSLITRPEILSRALLAGGTEAQKHYWLPKLASADPFCAVAITEPDYGSDVASMKLKAERVAGGWLLNGAKTWCTFAGKAGVLLTLARTDADSSLGHRGLSMFLVEKPASDGHEFRYQQPSGGVLSGKAIATIGYRGMHSFDVFYDQVFVPDDHLLGGDAGLGKGFYYTMAGFSGGRIQTAARANGLMQAAFEQGMNYAKERKVFGHAIADYQLTQVKLARMAILLTASKQFTYAVARLMDAGKGQVEASLVKLFACKTSEWLCREAMQIHGGMGYAEESAVSRYWIDSRVLSIFEGAEETLALKVIARSMIEAADVE
ncbi:acyl-CoA/acyl-ACP dehydrogenase [Dasania sp. GY-MA-18]|uniref:Acyl-CoA/acyl-ACP dehydrogenase n=1 Tax=Dasania phycosphaerae TaxID=2950436 RepID=A0A9J6RN50_9GAMM|nr:MULTISPECIES: acyl-CoA dehydrogenase family protein [Dasania]MCR8923521.1 acyl-CoA/acyl-ACP dehydrogenase [Dasania sp. GY-MA-18]MCZ0865955.1 acyl-CoA/acyl-ACP dehydrogenase [Dasania phycosphaerae]MCZ0869679.1 acyl-CoA/acyl-ACP dehydrogenase [Dasania phycosphaerae]